MCKKVIASLMLICFVVATSFMVIASDFPEQVRPSSGASNFEKKIGNVWTTAAFVVQTLSVTCVVILGIRYMMASADKRADIKHGLVMLVIGSVFVFCAATVARFIVDAGSEILYRN